MKLTLTQRLSVVFAVLLVICSGASAWLQVRSNRMHELEVVQGLSRDLAAHIARDTQLMDADGLKPEAVRNLFSQLMLVNPSVEVYLLDNDGRVVGNAAPSGHLLRDKVDLAPVRRFLSGAMLPILHELQGRFGYIDAAAIPMIAEALNVSKAETLGDVSF